MEKRILKSIIVVATSLWITTAYSQTPPLPEYQGKPAKYIFLFIGDGMSFPQVASYSVYKGTIDNNFIGTTKNPTPKNQPQAYDPSFVRFPILGAAKTYDSSKFITDSAAAATAIATGHKTLDGRLGIDAFGKSIPSIAELLKKKGYQIGIVTNVSINHATPAGFYAHQGSRGNYYQISQDLINSNFDYFGGGGFLQPTGKSKDQTHIVELAKGSGYKVVDTKAGFAALNAKDNRVIALNPDSNQSYSFLFNLDAKKDSLTLVDYTKKGIELLENNKQGFFMMVESGKIDWAGHANDALTMIKDVEILEKSVDVAIDFYNKHPNETLIVVTGDHETGGLSMGFGGTEYNTYFSLLKNQTISYEVFGDMIAEYRQNATPFSTVLKDIQQYYGLTTPENKDGKTIPALILNDREMQQLKAAYLESMIPIAQRERDLYYTIDYNMYLSNEPLQVTVTHILNNKAGIGWSTSAHTGLPAAVYAQGIGQEVFSGFYENTGIFDRIKLVSKIK